jgi:uncharacterized protein YbjQ (UPF0145 family)
VDDGAMACASCYTSIEDVQLAAAQDRAADLLPTTTTTTIQSNVTYLGLVFGETVLGVNLFSDVAAGVRDVVGGRSAAYEGKLADGRRAALREMQREAVRLGADAVIGVRVDYESLKGSMLMVMAQGTAVARGGTAS